MKNVLKWILYILLGLLILSIVAGLFAVLFSGYGMMRPGFRMMEPGLRVTGPYIMHSGIGILFGGLFCSGVILLVIVGIVALIYALTNRDKPSQTYASTPVSTPPVEVTAPFNPCSNCGKPTQEDWKTCPYCGNPLA